MGTARLEAFSDGVIAVIITIMVLEMKVPHGESIEALLPIAPIFLTYVLSFIYIGIYWNNHHHLLHAAQRVNGVTLWANLHFLFWLSLFPFATGWMGENHFAPVPTAVYGLVLLMAGMAYWMLEQVLIATQGPSSLLKQAVGRDWKATASLFLLCAAIAASFWSPWIAQGIYVFVAMLWFVPDRRIARVIQQSEA